jgi:GNAT superfamily N-acetyltransferase
MKIREASLADLEALSLLFNAYLEEQARWNPLFQLNPEFSSMAFIRNQVMSGSQMILLAQDDKEIIGFVRLNIQEGGTLLEFRGASADRLFQRLFPGLLFRKILAGLKAFIKKRSSLPPMSQPIVIGYLADIFIVPDRRGQGVGQLLLSHGIDWLKRQDVEWIYLKVQAENQRGIQFWQKNEFKPSNLFMIRKL